MTGLRAESSPICLSLWTRYLRFHLSLVFTLGTVPLWSYHLRTPKTLTGCFVVDDRHAQTRDAGHNLLQGRVDGVSGRGVPAPLPFLLFYVLRLRIAYPPNAEEAGQKWPASSAVLPRSWATLSQKSVSGPVGLRGSSVRVWSPIKRWRYLRLSYGSLIGCLRCSVSSFLCGGGCRLRCLILSDVMMSLFGCGCSLFSSYVADELQRA